MKARPINIAIAGNPNSGKSSLFNRLTGLNQKTGNYPGITVDKKSGRFKNYAEITDLPGTYSIYARSDDEKVVIRELAEKDRFDLVMVVVDATNLRRQMLLFTQIRDLGVPTVLVINMADILEKNGWTLRLDQLEKELSTDIFLLSARTGKGINELKHYIKNFEAKEYHFKAEDDFVEMRSELQNFLSDLKEVFEYDFPFMAWQFVSQPHLLQSLSQEKQKQFDILLKKHQINVSQYLTAGIIYRFDKIDRIVEACLERKTELKQLNFTRTIDRIATHKVFGFVLFTALLLLIFQAVFSWASVPMDFIDEKMGMLSSWFSTNLPKGFFNSLISKGLLPGLTGILIFVPQIALLFLFISILEESGYMSRVVFIMDRLLRPFGLNGKSVVPLLSGAACAIPAVMAARTIENPRERLLTVLVTPFMTCSARIPIYTILIALIVPSGFFYGIHYQAMALFGMYFLGAATALIASYILHKILKQRSEGSLLMEMPLYKLPSIKNTLFTVYEKSKTFVVEAGKVILSIALILWLLASFGPGDEFKNADQYVAKSRPELIGTPQFDAEVESYKLQHSFIGYLGKGIEPVIRPLGYDWKIGIALITSFAAREVFVGTMGTIYGLGSNSDEPSTIKKRMSEDVDSRTGKPLFSLPVALSLLLFYAFALQCMSTIAVVKRELKTWSYPLYQLLAMTALAYFSALVVYQLLS